MNGLTWLLRLDLPGGSVFLNDGGVTVWGGNTYVDRDPVIGSFSQVSEISDGSNSQLPELEVALAPPSNAALAPLQTAALQRSLVRLWLAEFDASTGAVIGTPDLRFSGRIDRVRQEYGLRQLGIILFCVPELEVLLFLDDGNGLSATFHKSVYPGETGHDQATGLVLPLEWGVKSQRRVAGSGSGGGGGGGGGFNQVDKS